MRLKHSDYREYAWDQIKRTFPEQRVASCYISSRSWFNEELFNFKWILFREELPVADLCLQTKKMVKKKENIRTLGFPKQCQGHITHQFYEPSAFINGIYMFNPPGSLHFVLHLYPLGKKCSLKIDREGLYCISTNHFH
ncbi:hypothetical protein ILYODFUR_007629 [Ilyodon furcidens]|uniref:Uncharacterized protein n=1 Tax=Ilyodon furcidens TaxID=33524 RepID=A0ABV0VET1_9TELE